MKLRPILFSTAMVRALLDGRKTQTRRVIVEPDSYGCLTGDCPHDHKDECAESMRGFCPYGVPGDLLWVRETFAYWSKTTAAYRSGGPCSDGEVRQFYTPTRWRPAIHMPRWASRLTLRLTDVRVQRVQEITEDDAIAEGIPRAYPIAKVEFQDLWDDINAERGYPWPSNPWVWALSFEVIKQNVDAYIFARGTGLAGAA